MDATIFDVDGTLCDVRTVRHHVRGPVRNFTAFHVESTGCPPMAQTAALWHATDGARLIVTARRREFEAHTVWWALLNGFEPDGLWMRDNWDQRPDVDVKRDMLADIRRQGFNVRHAVDDNPNVIGLWVAEGIPVTTIPGWED